MKIICLGISYRTAPVEIREKLAFVDQQISNFLLKVKQSNSFDEAVILSTCNRVEIYLTAEETRFDAVINQLSDQFNVSEEDIRPSVYKLVDGQVVAHLFRVASGLDSMVLGEPQILGQVTESYQTALEFGTVGARLSKLFLSAIHTGKRVRTETSIGKKSVSVSSMAVNLAANHIQDLKNAKVALLGAGEMAELAIEGFRKRGVETFFVISRTLASACKLAERWQGEAATMDMLTEIMENADILVCSSSAPHLLIHANLVKRIMEKRSNNPLTILDIAVPRDVDPKVGEIADVQLYDIDDLQDGVAQSQAAREREVPKAEKILNEEYHFFLDFLATLKVVPVIKQIRKNAEDIREVELEKMLRRIPDLTPEMQEHIHQMTCSLVKKLLHAPTVCLRQEAAGPDVDQFEMVTRHLFGLENSNGSS